MKFYASKILNFRQLTFKSNLDLSKRGKDEYKFEKHENDNAMVTYSVVIYVVNKLY